MCSVSQQNKALESTVQLSRVPSKTSRFLVQFRELSRVRSTESSGFMERAMGIESTSKACEVCVDGSRKKLSPTWVQILTN